MSGEVPCFKCGSTFDPAIPSDPESDYEPKMNQPYYGTTFHTFGHYGSTMFDPMDRTILEINICDACLRKYSRRVLHGRPLGFSGKYEYEKWSL